ncbi:Plasmid stabilization system protein ParE [Pilibacter termitis]|uniref:Plasmid stabilization system protein ParE n=1 Tax=Pilibacter termitis TaxID=263852 RepID=A0A1T4NDZ2_9ENTE|nr:type II toxin-antitoxin system RelE/ParE family toxin [Pilibacter termitis]SJZ77492.1 Plasmid stabilization system protein ParE [Pilibacter termitis]
MIEFKNVRLTLTAEDDLERLRDFLYYQTKSYEVLRKFDDEIENALKEIEDFPELYPQAFEESTMRKKIVWRYIIFYVEVQDYISITHIFHQSEDWLNKLKEELS